MDVLAHATGPNDLPPETLAGIFAHLAPIHPSGTPIYGTEDADWAAARPLAAVCRYWRATAVASQPLWTYVQPHRVPPAVCAALLSRSGSAPLSVFLDIEQLSHEVLQMVSAASARIKRFSVCLGRDADDASPFPARLHTLGELFQSPAPLLEELHVAPNLEDGEIEGPEAAYTLPVLFARAHPALRVVYLETISLWPHAAFHGLTELTVVRVFGAVDTVTPLLAVLRASPRLRRLTLDNALGWGGRALPRDVVPLPPSLQRLDVRDNVPECIQHLLTRLALPATAAVVLTKPVYESDLNDAPPFAGLLPADCGLLAPLRAVTTLYVHMSAWLVGWADGMGARRVAIETQDWTSLCWGPGFFDYEATSLLGPFPTAQLTTFVVNGTAWEDALALYSATAWAKVLEGMQALTTLAVSGDIPRLLAALLVPSQLDGSCVCPALRRILIRDVAVSAETLTGLAVVIQKRASTACPIVEVAAFYPGDKQASIRRQAMPGAGAGESATARPVPIADIYKKAVSLSVQATLKISLSEQDAYGRYWWEDTYNGETQRPSPHSFPYLFDLYTENDSF